MFWEYNLINFLVCVFDTYLIYDFVGYYEGVSPRLLTKKSRITVILLTSCIKFPVYLSGHEWESFSKMYPLSDYHSLSVWGRISDSYCDCQQNGGSRISLSECKGICRPDCEDDKFYPVSFGKTTCSQKG